MCAVSAVSQNVTGNLRVPILASRFWTTVATRAAMPKTAIYENSKPLLAENKVWVAG